LPIPADGLSRLLSRGRLCRCLNRNRLRIWAEFGYEALRWKIFANHFINQAEPKGIARR
jgi:hypothetical protein